MSGREFRDQGLGDGNGFYPGYDDGPTAPGSPGSGSGLTNLPVWTLVLIVVASGVATLAFLWVCVLVVCRKRRARRAAARDVEAQRSWEWERDAGRILPTASSTPVGAMKQGLDAERCHQCADAELTFVVMAGEDRPSYLARPAANVDTDAIAATPPTSEHASNSKPALESAREQPEPEGAANPKPALARAASAEACDCNA